MMQPLDVHGKNPIDAIREVAEANNRLVTNGQRGKLIINHGYGSTGKGGVIKERLRQWLAEHGLDFLCGELAGGNPGVTIIVLGKSIPQDALGSALVAVGVAVKEGKGLSTKPTKQIQALEVGILEFCTTAKPMRTISGRLRRVGESVVCGAVENLARHRLLRIVMKGRHKCYLTVVSLDAEQGAAGSGLE